MGSNLVIVAIPKEGDRVWKISSEKVPHLTILHLGDSDKISNLDQIMQFVEHAANTSLCTFWLPVDHRGELGEAKADVLFFKKGRYDFKAVRDFRSLLLKDTNIKSAYDAAQQFETPSEVGQPGQPWIPHLTLGYPETPAKPMPDEYNDTIYDVNFDRIGVWPGDFEGPEFRLKDYWEDFDEMDVPMDVAMGDLQHHGVKGQKWGVRKEKVGSGGHIRINEKTGNAGLSINSTALLGASAILMPPLVPVLFLSPRFSAEFAAARKVNKGVQDDKKWKKQLTAADKAAKVHNAAAKEVNAKIKAFNEDKRWKNSDGSKIDLKSNPTKQKEYDDAVSRELLNPEYAKAAVKIHGSSPTKRYELQIQDASNALLTVADTHQVRHADEEEMTVDFKIKRDANGHILGFEPQEKADAMTQTVDLGKAFLEHHGVKGMKWGVRKGALQQRVHENRVKVEATRREKRPARDVRAYDTIGTSKRQKSSIDTKGGEDHPPTLDAIKVASSQQKMKKSGLKALSNQELQEMERRLNLEASVKRLTEGEKTAGQKFVDGIFGRGSEKDKKSFESRAGQKAGQEVFKAATPHVLRAVRKHAVGF